jgi:hypothetical protein
MTLQVRAVEDYFEVSFRVDVTGDDPAKLRRAADFIVGVLLDPPTEAMPIDWDEVMVTVNNIPVEKA